MNCPVPELSNRKTLSLRPVRLAANSAHKLASPFFLLEPRCGILEILATEEYDYNAKMPTTSNEV